MIPDEALHAAASAIRTADDATFDSADDSEPTLTELGALELARAALEAAAPFMCRTITTAEELELLPGEAVLRNANGSVCEVWTLELGEGPSVMVYSVAGNPEDWPVDRIALPATVLWEPTRGAK